MSKRDVLSGAELFDLAGIERIHINGCSWSETTRLHRAMLCCTNAVLSPNENRPEYPFLRERLKLALRHGFHRGRKFYVTKRDFDRHHGTNVDKPIAAVKRENIGQINMVREPRNVMISRHTSSTSEARGVPYFTSQNWYVSVTAVRWTHLMANSKNRPLETGTEPGNSRELSS